MGAMAHDTNTSQPVLLSVTRCQAKLLCSARNIMLEAPVSRRRILGQLGLFAFVWLGVTVIGTAPPLLEALGAVGVPESIAGSVAGLLAAVAGVVVVQRVLRGPSLAQLGFTRGGRWVLDLAVGLLLGPLLFWTVFSVVSWLGVAKLAGIRLDVGALLAALVAFVCVGAAEELVMRGVVLQQVALGWGVVAGVGVSSAVFALIHVPNVLVAEVDPLVGVLAVVILGLLGLIFAGAYLWTERLWLPIALHVSWNFGQGALLGFPVSGTPSQGLVQPALAGPDWLTGGSFGPEGGVVGLLAIGLAGLVVWAYAGANRRVAPPR
jgi:membrane protease YdiL (CAAX protease family)